MRWLRGAIFVLLGGFALLETLARISRRFHPRPCPPYASWILENPFRRGFLSASATLEKTGIREGMKVLELGPGPGFFTVEASHIIGDSGRLCCLDLQPKMIAKVRRKVERGAAANVDLIVGDANALPFADGSLDLAFLICVLGEIPHRDVAVRELHRVLRPDGILSITECIIDPDYSTRSAVIAMGEGVGFKPVETLGDFLYYTSNFRKEEAKRGRRQRRC